MNKQTVEQIEAEGEELVDELSDEALDRSRLSRSCETAFSRVPGE